MTSGGYSVKCDATLGKIGWEITDNLLSGGFEWNLGLKGVGASMSILPLGDIVFDSKLGLNGITGESLLGPITFSSLLSTMELGLLGDAKLAGKMASLELSTLRAVTLSGASASLELSVAGAVELAGAAASLEMAMLGDITLSGPMATLELAKTGAAGISAVGEISMDLTGKIKLETAVTTMGAILKGIIDGSIDIVATDHAPHTIAEKKNLKKPGFPGLETTIPILMDLHDKKIISLKRIYETLIANPINRFNLKGIGKLMPGYKADLVIIDPTRVKEIEPSKFFSKAKYSPFDGKKFKGVIMSTFVNGQLVFNEGQIIAKPGIGNIIQQSRESQ